jgi:D-glycero-alpha-D-manno-heptose-7-phosphate kinase
MAVFYEKYGGCVLSTSINKYIYVLVNPCFYKNYTILKYSKVEEVREVRDIEHPIFRYLLNAMGISNVEIASVSDIPAGAGLGSSSSFTVGLLNALLLYKGEKADKGRLAEEACIIEIEKLGSPIGKQDQYAAAFGGFNFIEFNENGTVAVKPLSMKRETYA